MSTDTEEILMVALMIFLGVMSLLFFYLYLIPASLVILVAFIGVWFFLLITDGLPDWKDKKEVFLFFVFSIAGSFVIVGAIFSLCFPVYYSYANFSKTTLSIMSVLLLLIIALAVHSMYKLSEKEIRVKEEKERVGGEERKKEAYERETRQEINTIPSEIEKSVKETQAKIDSFDSQRIALNKRLEDSRKRLSGSKERLSDTYFQIEEERSLINEEPLEVILESIIDTKSFLQTLEEESEEIKISDDQYIKKYNVLINRIDHYLGESNYG